MKAMGRFATFDPASDSLILVGDPLQPKRQELSATRWLCVGRFPYWEDGSALWLRISSRPTDHRHRYCAEFQSAVRCSHSRRDSVSCHARGLVRPEKRHQYLTGCCKSKLQERQRAVLESECPAAGYAQHGNHDWLFRIEGHAPGG